MLVQIYEVSTPKEAVELVRIGVDHIGVLTGTGAFPNELSYAETARIFDAVPSAKAKRVALSLSSKFEEIVNVVLATRPDILHIGAAFDLFSPEQTRRLRTKLPAISIMRSIPIIGPESIALARQYEKIVDLLLLDSYSPRDKQIGALGCTHDWNISRRIVKTVKTPVILAGGLGPDNVIDAIRAVDPTGVDSKTKTDQEGGQGKDIEKVRKFVAAAKTGAIRRK